MEEQAGRQVLRAGFLEVVVADGSLLPVWAALEGLSPLHDLRPEWSDGLLLLYSDSRCSRRLVSYSLDDAKLVVTADVLAFHMPGLELKLRCSSGAKVVKKWAQVVRLVCAPGDPGPIAAIQVPLQSDDRSLAVVEMHLQRTIEECALYQALADHCGAQRKCHVEQLSTSESRIEELRVMLMRLKKEQGLATPVANRQAPTVSVSENNHLMGRSIAALIAALRQKGAGADLVAKHVYYAMGHRPIQDERADAVMSPSTVNLVDELPKTSAAAQHEQLVVFISKDDPFAMRMVREYATLFLRLRGLDVDLAMRRLLYHFKLPKESQQIGRVIRAFAEAYFELHAQLRPFDASSQAFAPTSPDEHLSYGPGEHIDWPDCESVELVFFALVMLNGDLHNPENTEKMTRAQFVDNIHRSGAKVVLEEETLKDLYGHIQVDPIVFDNAAQLYVDAIRRSYVEIKVNATPGLRLWTKCWVVVTENYDYTTAIKQQERRSGGMGILYVCKSPTENVTYLTFPLRRTVGLVQLNKKEFCLVQSHGAGTVVSTASASIRNVLGGSTVRQEETRIKFRCKTERDMTLWLRALHYLLTGGFGTWYPKEVRDTENLDLPEDEATTPVVTVGGGGKTRRRRLKSSKKTRPSGSSTSPRQSAPPSAESSALNSPRRGIDIESDE